MPSRAGTAAGDPAPVAGTDQSVQGVAGTGQVRT